MAQEPLESTNPTPGGDGPSPENPGREQAVSGETQASAAQRRRAQLGRLLGRGRVLGTAFARGVQPTAGVVRADLANAFGHLRRVRHLGAIAAGALLALYLLSGTYVVSSGEAAVVTRFGRVVQPRVAPGLRWHLPWPIETARTVNIAQVRREGIGVTLEGHPVELHPPEDIQLLTGDTNLLAAKAIVQYRVKDPADYLFRVAYNEDPLLRDVIKAALTQLAGATTVDVLLTSGRPAFQQAAREQVQQTLDKYASGIEIVSIDLQEIAPPADVAPAFRDVASAAEEKNKLINDAQGYANSVIPQARGEAEARVSSAEGYQTDVVNRASGEAGRFNDVLAQYQRDSQIYGSEVTRYRMYVETMEQILPRARKYVVEPGANGEQVTLRLMEQLAAPLSEPAPVP